MKLKEIMNAKYALEVYCVIMLIFQSVFYSVNSYIGMAFLLFFSIIMFLISKRSIFMIHGLSNLLFMTSAKFILGDIPIFLIVIAVLFIILYLVFFIRKKNFYKSKFFIPYTILTIAFIIPIFWSCFLENGLFTFYFNYLLYFIIFLIILLSSGHDTFNELLTVYSYIPLLIVYECAYTLILNPDSYSWYTLGWGICNEAGIMLMFFLPFIFIKIYIDEKLCYVDLFKIIFVIIGFNLVSSR